MWYIPSFLITRLFIIFCLRSADPESTGSHSIIFDCSDPSQYLNGVRLANNLQNMFLFQKQSEICLFQIIHKRTISLKNPSINNVYSITRQYSIWPYRNVQHYEGCLLYNDEENFYFLRLNLYVVIEIIIAYSTISLNFFFYWTFFLYKKNDVSSIPVGGRTYI